MLFTFPDLNKWSSPLLFLTIQGLIFVFLLFWRWYKERKPSDLILGFYRSCCVTTVRDILLVLWVGTIPSGIQKSIIALMPYQSKKELWTVGTKIYKENSIGVRTLLVTLTGEDENQTVKIFE